MLAWAKDTDTNFENHLLLFNNAVDCHLIGSGGHRVKMMPIEVLTWYGQCFKPGSIRARTYETAMRKARRAGRLPQDAEAVLKEIQADLGGILQETEIQMHTRLDTEYERLEQGALEFQDFKARFEAKIQDMEEANMSIVNLGKWANKG